MANAFDVTRFNNVTANQFQYHIRTFSTAFPEVRSDGINNLDGSLSKTVVVGERRYVQIRVEGFNLMNHATFAAANNTASNSAFGTISSTANRARMLQLVARILF